MKGESVTLGANSRSRGCYDMGYNTPNGEMSKGRILGACNSIARVLRPCYVFSSVTRNSPYTQGVLHRTGDSKTLGFRRITARSRAEPLRPSLILWLCLRTREGVTTLRRCSATYPQRGEI